ncbi:type II toxin-antitoxin system VapC family toxin [Sphingomonas sp. PB4P5]|uniref:type II toxin-antitoxin system VapC family toxin n=1 Tax=Parasphingomonas puruogangriensis TaxID=3096155 RepID=UPI002FC6D7B1
MVANLADMTARSGPHPAAVLLDTCALIWLGNRSPIAAEAWKDIRHAGLADGVFVSPVSAWEIGLLAAAAKVANPFAPNANAWFAQMMSAPGIRPAALTPDIAIDSAVLPGAFHRDPADRLLVATARAMNIPLVTRDSKILAYAAAGHVAAIAC